jgi:SAM-dependent methyltransferase
MIGVAASDAKYRFCPWPGSGRVGTAADMTGSDGQVTHAAARAYARVYVPALFAEWAPRVADAAEVREGHRALDVACGTGVVAHELAARIGPDHVVGVDRNPGMLAVAREMEPAIEWREANADALPTDLGSFDAVTCQFALMFFADRTRALRGMFDALRPGGRLVVAVWAGLADNAAYGEIVSILREIGAPAAAAELSAPFCLGERDAVLDEFRRAEIDDVRITTTQGQGRFGSIRAWVDADVEAWTLGPHLGSDRQARLRAEAERRLGRFVDAEGRVAFASVAHLVSATRG